MGKDDHLKGEIFLPMIESFILRRNLIPRFFQSVIENDVMTFGVC